MFLLSIALGLTENLIQGKVLSWVTRDKQFTQKDLYSAERERNYFEIVATFIYHI